MENYSITLPAWTVGEKALDKVVEICAPHGKTAALIGGRRALGAIAAQIRRAVQGKIDITAERLYGGEASRENIDALLSDGAVQGADMLFAVGGGKALDTVKALGLEMNKPVFAFPTIASTCAACTAVSILYHPDGSFAGPCFLKNPPVHTFICTPVIAAAPKKYLWAGLGDTYAKFFEAEMSSRGDQLSHYHALGVGASRMCLEPLLAHGAAALRDQQSGRLTDDLTQTILTVIVNTAVASILLTADKKIDYNTGLAHAIFYALTAFPELEIEKNHLHGEVVGFGVLALLLVDGQKDMFETMLRFNRSVGLPTRLRDIGVTEAALGRVLPQVLKMKDIEHNPYPITLEMLQKAFEELEREGA